MSWKQYVNSVLNENLNEVTIKTIEAAVDYALEKTNNKKDAIKFIDNSKDNFIKKNKQKIKDMINKLPNGMFK